MGRVPGRPARAYLVHGEEGVAQSGGRHCQGAGSLADQPERGVACHCPDTAENLVAARQRRSWCLQRLRATPVGDVGNVEEATDDGEDSGGVAVPARLHLHTRRRCARTAFCDTASCPLSGVHRHRAQQLLAREPDEAHRE